MAGASEGARCSSSSPPVMVRGGWGGAAGRAPGDGKPLAKEEGREGRKPEVEAR